MNLKNKILTMSDGQKLYFMTSKPIEDGKRYIYLTDTEGTEDDYSLWYVEPKENDDIVMSPYKGADSADLKRELMELFVETAFEE